VLIVAVHDVAPSTLGEVRWLLERLDQAGVRPRVLKVVPGEPDASPRLTEELARLVGEEAGLGSEIVLHGWTHRADRPYRGSRLDRLRARLFAAGTAEFLSLPAAEMRDRLDSGRRWLADRGVDAPGFCAPAWLWARELPSVAEAAGSATWSGCGESLTCATRGRSAWHPPASWAPAPPPSSPGGSARS
jgi:predicted deacetylase